MKRILALAFLPLLAAAPDAAAGGPRDKAAKAQRKADDHDAARQAVLRREVLPLPRILTLANGYQPGEVIEIELEAKDGRLYYDVHVLTATGVVRELFVDARTGRLILNRVKRD